MLFRSTSSLRKKFDSALFKDKLGLSIGEHEIVITISEKLRRRIIPTNIWAFTVFLFVVTGLFTSITYVVAFPAPNNIYIPAYEYTKGDYDEVYLTEDEVHTLKKQGDIVRGYEDENTPLYRMHRRGVAKAEYIRYILSYGLWAGSLVSIAFLLIWFVHYNVRLLTRNKRIGDEYKENVLIVHNYYRIPGGEDIVVANEKALLEGKGHKVVFYSRNNGDVRDGGLWNKIKLAFAALFNVRTYRDICRIIDKEKIE